MNYVIYTLSYVSVVPSVGVSVNAVPTPTPTPTPVPIVLPNTCLYLNFSRDLSLCLGFKEPVTLTLGFKTCLNC